MSLSGPTIAALARPFDGGGGPSHSSIELIWASADASEYLPAEGNKVERVLAGMRALRSGRKAAPGQSALPADTEKLGLVASDLAARLVAAGLVDPRTVEDALEEALDATGQDSLTAATRAARQSWSSLSLTTKRGSGKSSATRV
jgi:hypothetical protein